MSSQPLPPEIAEAIRRLDTAIANLPDESLADWRLVRGYCRTKHSESKRALPAASLVAQEIAQSRSHAQASQSHAQAALDAMADVFGGHKRQEEQEEEEQPDTVKLKKPPL